MMLALFWSISGTSHYSIGFRGPAGFRIEVSARVNNMTSYNLVRCSNCQFRGLRCYLHWFWGLEAFPSSPPNIRHCMHLVLAIIPSTGGELWLGGVAASGLVSVLQGRSRHLGHSCRSKPPLAMDPSMKKRLHRQWR